MDKNQQFSEQTASANAESAVVQCDVTHVDVEPIPGPPVEPVVPPDRRLSMLAWAVAVVLFIFNRKLGIVFFVILLVFRQYPTFSLKSLPGKCGSLFKKPGVQNDGTKD